LNTGLPLAFQAQPVANPLQMAMAAQQFQAQRENMLGMREQREAVAEGRRMQNEQRQNAMNDQAALDRAVKPGAGLDEILAGLPGHMHAGVTKQWTEANEAADKARKAKAEAATTEADYLGTLAATVKSYNYDPQAAGIVLSHAKSQGHDVSQIEALLQNDPSKLQSVVDSMIQASPKQRELLTSEKNAASSATTAATGATRLQLELPKITADGQVAQQVAAGTKGGMTPQQQAVDKRDAQRIGLEGQRLAFEKQKAVDAKGDKTDLSPEGLDAAALMFAKTGQLPALGNGDKDTRKQIINRAAVLMPGLDVASAKADFGANSDSLKVLQKQRDAVGAFEQTARKNIDIFLETAGKVVDTGSPMANTAARLVSGKMLGSPDQAKYDAARQVAINEIAKITSSPTLSGTLSDSARHEVEAFNPQNATLKQSVAVMRLLKRDMDNRATSLDEQIGAIQGRIKKAGPGSAAPGGGAHNDPMGIR
jgi:hypothetical protein